MSGRWVDLGVDGDHRLWRCAGCGCKAAGPINTYRPKECAFCKKGKLSPSSGRSR